MRQYSPNGYSRTVHVKDVIRTMLTRGRAAITALAVLSIGFLVASCGGSGGSGNAGAGASSQLVGGVAATGSPLAGGQVTLRDSSSARSEKLADIDPNGSFAVDVAGMTAPFILKATGAVDGISHTMFSFADKPGTANINPLSTVAVANSAGVDDPAQVFDAPDSAALDKTKSAMPASMPAAVATLRLKLKPLLAAFSADNTDPVKDSFSADHSGLDGVFDNVKVVIANGTITITNANTDAVIFTAQVKDIEHGQFTDRDDDVPKPGTRPAAPTGVTAVGGDGQVTVSWDPVANATSYDIFYATKSKVTEEEEDDGVHAKRVKNVTSPFVITGLAPSTTYFVMVRARINGRRGPASDEVSATTTGTTPPSTTTTTGGTTTTTTAGATTSTTAGATTTTTARSTTTTTAGGGTTTTAPPTTTTTTTTTPPTTTTTASTTTTTLAINGAALYNTNCSGCHGPLATSTHHRATASQISAGIAGVSSMRSSILVTNGGIALTAAQIAAISAALQ